MTIFMTGGGDGAHTTAAAGNNNKKAPCSCLKTQIRTQTYVRSSYQHVPDRDVLMVCPDEPNPAQRPC